MDKIKVFVVEEDIEFRNEVEEMLANVDYITLAGESVSLKDAVGQLERNGVDVVLMGAIEEGDTYLAAEKLYAEFPETAIVILEEKLSEEIMHRAFIAGIKDIVIKPVVPSKLVDSIFNANNFLKTKAPAKKDNGIKSKTGLGHVFTIFSTKGGVGKSFIAVNLAVALAKLSGKRVALLDFDLDFGNIALALNIVPKYTVSDVVDEIMNVDQHYIENYLIPHDSGIKVLPSNTQPMINEFINAEDIDIILRTIQSVFDYVVVDMPGRFYKPVNPAFAVADRLLIVTTPEMSSVRNVKAALAMLKELNYPRTKIRLILNKVDRRDAIKYKDVETTLGYDIFAAIRADYARAAASMNIGIPVVTRKVGSVISRDINHLAKKLIDDCEEKKEPKEGTKRN